MLLLVILIKYNMNRIVLIGNGFDLAHGLKTKYEDFINWYWSERIRNLKGEKSYILKDCLCTIRNNMGRSWAYLFEYGYINIPLNNVKDIIEWLQNSEYYCIEMSDFFSNICQSIETKGWVDIEYEYYNILQKAIDYKNDYIIDNLNNELEYIQKLLVEYLMVIDQDKVPQIEINTNIKNQIYSYIDSRDIAIESSHTIKEHIEGILQLSEDEWIQRMENYGYTKRIYHSLLSIYKEKVKINDIDISNVENEILLPNKIMFLNFNYTRVAEKYLLNGGIFHLNYIHGNLNGPHNIIFGYGDDTNDKYDKIILSDDNRYLNHIKTFKYLEASNYRDLLYFINSEPFQVFIMGHSCGSSDRTLLKTIFENTNCVSIKPFYYRKDNNTDNYRDIIQNISRNFTSTKLMRDKVVNKLYCSTLS